MKKIIPCTVFLAAITIFFLNSCTPKDVEKEECSEIENTLKSVSFWNDSLNLDPTLLLASLDRINKAIDSIGYPDAGYQLWIVQEDSAADYRFVINGNWPNQDLYNEIHNHELYKNASAQEEIWNKLINISYDRFVKVK